jgi:hypothetical protein
VKRNSPPWLALWLFARLAGRYHREAMVGDLLEECRLGRSSLWCWQQVLCALVARVRSAVRPRLTFGLLLVVWWWTLLAVASYEWKWPVLFLAADPTLYLLCGRRRRTGTAVRMDSHNPCDEGGFGGRS